MHARDILIYSHAIVSAPSFITVRPSYGAAGKKPTTDGCVMIKIGDTEKFGKCTDIICVYDKFLVTRKRATKPYIAHVARILSR